MSSFGNPQQDLARALEDATSRLEDFESSIAEASRSSSDLTEKKQREGRAFDRFTGATGTALSSAIGSSIQTGGALTVGQGLGSFAANALTLLPGFGNRLDDVQRAGGFVQQMLAPAVRAGAEVDQEQVKRLFEQFQPMFERERKLEDQVRAVVGEQEGDRLFDMAKEILGILQDIGDAISNFIGGGD